MNQEFVNAKPKRWLEALEFKGFKISHTKVEYMNCNFNRDVHMICFLLYLKFCIRVGHIQIFQPPTSPMIGGSPSGPTRRFAQ